MNKIEETLIIGRLGKDPDLKYTKNQKAVCYFSVAENIKNSDKPKWHNIVVWGKLGENCKLNLKQGQKIFVQGQIKENEFSTKDGLSKRSIELIAQNVGISLD